MVNLENTNKDIRVRNPFVNDKYLVESQKWKNLFLTELREGNFQNLKAGRSKSIERCQVSPILIRQGKSRDESEFHRDNLNNLVKSGGQGNIGRYQILATMTGYLASEPLESEDVSEFRLGYACMDGFKQPIIMKYGSEIRKIGCDKGFRFMRLEELILDLGEDFRDKFNSNDNVSKYLNQYLTICNDFVGMINK